MVDKNTAKRNEWPSPGQFRKSIRTEFTLYICGIILILMGITGYIITDKYVNPVTYNVVEKLLAQSRAYSGSAGKLIISTNGPDALLLNNICNRMKTEDSDIYWVGITDKYNKFLAHTDLSNVISGAELHEIGNKGFENLLISDENIEIRSDTIFVSVPVLEKDITVGRFGIASSNQRIIEARSTSIITVASVTIIMILIGLPLTMVILNRKLKPITAITKGLREVNPDNIAINIPVSQRNEFGYLAETLKVMGNQLNSAQRKLIEQERFERELEIAREIQANMLPNSFPKSESFEFHGMYDSAREVGGDYYDFIDIDQNRKAFLVADVSGKSLPGMLVMLMTRDIIRSLIHTEHNPARLLSMVNNELLQNIRRGTFVTMFFGVIEHTTGVFDFASAGHNPLLKINAGEKIVRRIKTRGFPLGMVPSDQFQERIENGRIDLRSNDWLIQYTDGVNEAQNADQEEFGMDRFEELLRRDPLTDPKSLVDRIIANHKEFTGNLPQFDDITLLVMKWKTTNVNITGKNTREGTYAN